MHLRSIFLPTISLWWLKYYQDNIGFSLLCFSLFEIITSRIISIHISANTLLKANRTVSVMLSKFFQPLPITVFWCHFHMFRCVLYKYSSSESAPHPVLTVASWTAYRFLKRQVRWVWYSPLFQNFPQCVVIHTVKTFGIVNKTEVDVFFWNARAFSMIQ